MWTILQETFSKADVFWSALGAIATLGAFIFLLIELPKIRRESATYKVEGLKVAKEHLHSNEFRSWYENIRTAWHAGGNDYPSEVEGDIVSALYKLDYVARLIKLGYIDKALLFYEFADDLYSLERFLTNFDHRQNSQIPNVRARYPDGYALLKEAATASRQETKNAFARLDKFKTN